VDPEIRGAVLRREADCGVELHYGDLGVSICSNSESRGEMFLMFR
jgi:hypothetical protein